MHSGAWVALALLASPNGSAQPPPGLERVTFDEAVRLALSRNTSTQVSLLEIRRAEGLLSEARAGSLPTIVGNGTYSRLDADRVLNGNVILSKHQLNLNAVGTLPLLVPNRWAQWSHGADNLDAAKTSDADVRRQTAITAGRAYLAIVAQKRVLESIERARDTARAHYIFSRTRREGGVGNRIDEVQNALAAVVRAQEALGIVTGADRPLDSAEEPTFPPAPDVAEATRAAEERRQDVRAAQSRASAADHINRDSWLDYLPSLFATFQPFYQDPASLTVPTTGWQAQLLLTITIYDGGIRSGLAKERDAFAGEAHAQLDGLLRQTRSEVRLAYETLQRADAGLRESRLAAQLATEALKLADRAYQAGATGNLDVIDAERRARDAATAVAIAEDAVRQARLDLLSATGHFP